MDSVTDNEMHVRGENEKVSIELALQSLEKAKELLDAYRDENAAWQDPVELLNTSASALDEAGLALRKNEENNPQKKAMVSSLSEQVVQGRQEILDATQQVVAGKRPAELWNPNTLIVYATHTGTSKEYALELQRHLSSADIMNIKDLSLLDLQERKRVFIVCSTFGFGRPPRDAEVVYTTLQILDTTEDLVAAPETQALVGLEVGVAALGNSNFTAFCKFGQELSTRLCALGAQEILPVALIDAKNGKSEQKRQFTEWQQQVMRVEGIIEEAPSKETPREESTIVQKHTQTEEVPLSAPAPKKDSTIVRKDTQASSNCCTIL